jgi:hypothetical protein
MSAARGNGVGMKKLLAPALTLPLFLVAACDSGSGPATKTKLDAVEVEPGTASDAMIMLDDSDVDGTAVDNSAVLTAEGQAAAKAEAEKAAPAEEPEAEAPAEEAETEAEAAE